MKQKKRFTKAYFCCPRHGVLQNPVEYLDLVVSTDSKVIVDVSVVCCKRCDAYYTTPLFTGCEFRYRGKRVFIGLECGERNVRIPYSVDIDDYYKQEEQRQQEEDKRQEHLRIKREEEEKLKERIRIEKKERQRKYFDSLPEILHDRIVLTNKPRFIKEHKCPYCGQAVKLKHVKIVHHNMVDPTVTFLFTKINSCENCNTHFITPKQFDFICEKACKKIRRYFRGPFVAPVNIDIEYNSEYGNLFIPKWAFDSDKYDRHHLPPRGDELYDMTDEEYQRVVEFHQPEYPVQLRPKSFLGEAGYSTNESEIQRYRILAKCVAEYGKSKVINQIKNTMDRCIKQKNGSIKYQRAINIWRGDILYVENKL